MFFLKLLFWIVVGFVACFVGRAIAGWLAKRIKIASLIIVRLLFCISSIIFVLFCAFVERVDSWVMIVYILQANYFYFAGNELVENFVEDIKEVEVTRKETDVIIDRNLFGDLQVNSNTKVTTHKETQGVTGGDISFWLTLLGPIAAAILTGLFAAIFVFLCKMDGSSPLPTSLAFGIVGLLEFICSFVGLNWIPDVIDFFS